MLLNNDLRVQKFFCPNRKNAAHGNFTHELHFFHIDIHPKAFATELIRIIAAKTGHK